MRVVHRVVRPWAAAGLLRLLFSPLASALVGQSPSVRDTPVAPCTIAGVNAKARCGVHAVFEDRAAAAGRTIGLHVVLLEAALAPRAADPIVILAGGPGTGAAELARQFGARAMGYRDIVLVDQRGTGESNRLTCSLGASGRSVQLLDSLFPDAIVQRCLAQESGAGDLTKYTTTIDVDDLDDALTWLGYDHILLVGASYGTRVALEFVRRHGDRVRAMRLSAPLAPTEDATLDAALNANVALKNLFRRCEASQPCHAAFPNLGREFDDIIARLEAAPVAVRVSIDGAERDFRLGRRGFADAVRRSLYGPLARWLPVLIHEAHESGDLSWFAEYFAAGRFTWDELAMGMYFSVECSESFPVASPNALAAATTGTFTGDGRYKQQMAACSIGPRGTVPADLHSPAKSSVPTIIETGQLDPITPARYAWILQRTLPNAIVVIWPNGGHGGPGTPADYQCASSLDRALFQQASTAGLDVSCVQRSGPLEFPTKGRPPRQLMGG